MNILFISPFFTPVRGGMETHLFFLAKELTLLGHHVEVYTSDLNRDGRISKKEETIEGIHVKRFSTWFKLGQFAAFFPGIFLALKKSQADIIHIHNFRHPINLAVFFTSKPCLLTFHWPQYPPGLRKNKMDFFATLFDKILAKKILYPYKKVCAVTPTEIPFIQSFKIPKEKIILTPNAIPKKLLTQEDGRSFRIKNGLKENDFLVLSLSRIHQSKGFDMVIHLAKYYPHVQFLIAGKDEGYKISLQNLIQELHVRNVHFTGELTEEEKIQAYAACDLFLHPSHFEAFGIVVLEAMSQTKPILSSDAGGLPWLVSDTGFMFKDGDLLDLQDKFKRLLYSPSLRKKLSEKSFKKASSLTWDKIAAHLEKNYKELL